VRAELAAAGAGLADVIRQRRTNLRMDREAPVDPAIVLELCELAVWAPNHHRTEPWRFAVFTGDGRSRLGDAVADAMEAAGRPPKKVAKTRTKYLRAPVMVVVGCAPGESDVESIENRDAVAAGIQNLLLGATDRGLASFWSSVAMPSAQGLLDLCRFEPGTVAVAAVYLGHPIGDVATPPRSPAAVTWIE